MFPSLAILPRVFMKGLGAVSIFFFTFCLLLIGCSIVFYAVFGDTLAEFRQKKKSQKTIVDILLRDLFQTFITIWQLMLGTNWFPVFCDLIF